MTDNETKYRLGLDIGVNSIGWAAVRLGEDGEPRGLLDMGVRIFPDGRDPQSEASNAVDRRTARGQRRRRDRYLKRRSALMDSLVEFGLMPSDSSERKVLEDRDPYRLRASALDDALQPHELGRSLFHLNQRRGFKSNRKAQGKDESEESEMLKSIDALRSAIRKSGARTLGEFMARRHKKGETTRARAGVDLRADRAMYQEEFDHIRKAQEPHHSLSGEQWDALHEAIFFQRPLKPVEPGWCLLEENEKRAARALPVFQEYRMLQEVNNLRVRVGIEPERPLDYGERERAMNRLRSGNDIKLSEGKENKPAKPPRDLKLPSGATFNLAAGGRKSIKGDETAARLMRTKKSKTEPARTLFGDRWLQMPMEERNEIVKFLLDTEDAEEARRRAVEDWGMDAAQAEALARVALVSGYGNLSEKAIGKLLPHLESGLVYSEAVKAAGYDSHSDFRSGEAHDRLPYYGVVLPRDAVGADSTKDSEVDGEPARYGRIANPTVHIGLGQLRRVVNRLIDAYGKPQGVVVELARDLKMNSEEKLNLNRQQRKGRDDNERFKEMLESVEEEVTADKLRKLRLWEEQARVCPYTGRQLSFEMVVSSQTEIDHILPFSRTLDNAMSNMVVCVAAANRDKGDRSPYEAFGHSPAGYDYEAILANAAGLPRNKRWRFDKDAMERYEDERGFLDRHLNETGYLSRTARSYLAHLYDEKSDGQRVYAVPGRVTALLRRGWELEGMLRVTEDGEITGKQREDHRHHAIDAFVVANTSRGLLQRFARASGAPGSAVEERLSSVAKEAPPWHGFDSSELRPFLDKLVVSYKPDHGTPGGGSSTGKLHEETAYGLIEFREDGPSKVVTRKKLSDFKRRRDLESVRDAGLRAALLALWDSIDAETDRDRAAVFADRAVSEDVMVGNALQRVRRVRVTDEQTVIPIRDSAGEPYKGYKPGGNEFADVWKMSDGSWRLVAVPSFHANQPDFNIEDFRPRTTRGRHKGKVDPRARRLMRLYKDDLGALGEGPDRRIVRVRKFGDGYVVLDDHNEANVDGRERRGEKPRNNGHSASRLLKEGFRIVKVDEMGRVKDPGAFQL